MLSYRHSFHAGNHADVLKHTVQSLIIESLKEKEKPFLYLDTHAGAGRYQLSNARRRQLQQPEIQPNAAHLALAKLQDALGDRFLLVTQNIDNLHERAGNTNVIHMHGELLKVRCSQSGQVLDWTGDVTPEDKCHCCQFPAPLNSCAGRDNGL